MRRDRVARQVRRASGLGAAPRRTSLPRVPPLPQRRVARSDARRRAGIARGGSVFSSTLQLLASQSSSWSRSIVSTPRLERLMSTYWRTYSCEKTSPNSTTGRLGHWRSMGGTLVDEAVLESPGAAAFNHKDRTNPGAVRQRRVRSLHTRGYSTAASVRHSASGSASASPPST